MLKLVKNDIFTAANHNKL